MDDYRENKLRNKGNTQKKSRKRGRRRKTGKKKLLQKLFFSRIKVRYRRSVMSYDLWRVQPSVYLRIEHIDQRSIVLRPSNAHWIRPVAEARFRKDLTGMLCSFRSSIMCRPKYSNLCAAKALTVTQNVTDRQTR